MGKFLRISAWLLLVSGLTWVAVIAYWQVAEVRPQARDLVLYLGVLPLAIFAVLVLGKRGYDSARHKASAQSAEPEADAGSAPVAASGPPATPMPPLAILDGALHVPAGLDPANVLAALAGSASPALHDRLRDRDGFPAFAAWDRDLDVDAIADRLDALDGTRADEEQSRALALLLPMATDLIATIATQHWPDASADGRFQAPHPAAPLARLQVSLFLPAGWPAALSAAARELLVHEAQAMAIPAPHLAIETLPASSAEAIWQRIAAIAREPVDPAAPVLHLLLACQSLVGARSVQRLEQSGQLLTSRQPEGLLPGEGAAGVLLLAGEAAGGLAQPPRAWLRAYSTAHAGVSWQPRTGAQQIAGQLQDLIALASVDGDAPTSVVSDADLRRNRNAALGSALSQVLPDIDIEHDSVRTGIACGELGIVAPLVLLALATAKTEADAAPSVAMAIAEADRRTFALITPPLPAAAAAADSTPGTPQAA